MRTAEVMMLAVVIAAAATGAAWLALRRGVLCPPFEFGPVDEILGALYGVVLAILVLFASEHYTDARNHAEMEASGLNDIFRIAANYPAAERDQIRHDSICYAREAIRYDWTGGQLGPAGSVVLNARAGLLHKDANEIAARHSQSYLLTSLFDGEIKQSEGHQLRLSDRQGRVPLVVWIVIYVGVGIIMVFLALRYLPQGRHGIVALPAITLVLTLMVGIIYMLDHPYGSTINLEPRGLKSFLRAAPVTSGQPLPADVGGPCNLPRPPAGSLRLSRSDLVPPELPPSSSGH